MGRLRGGRSREYNLVMIWYSDISSDNLVYLVGLCDTHTRFWYVNTPCVSSVFFIGASIPDIHLSCKFSSLKLWLAIF